MKRKRINKGFTLIELLVVIVIVGIIFFIGYVSVNKIIENARKKSFVNYINSIVDVIKLNNSLKEDSYCFYDLNKDKNNNNPNIENLYVIYNKNNSKEVISVYATYTNKKYVIDIADYSKFDYEEEDTWDLIEKDTAFLEDNYVFDNNEIINSETILVKKILTSNELLNLGSCNMQEVKE